MISKIRSFLHIYIEQNVFYMEETMKNKGFSLVELIIVVAIMAILVGFAAPMLYTYIEKANVSSDIQFCSSIKDAVMIACSDPDVVTATDDSSTHVDMLRSGNVCEIDSSFLAGYSTSEFSDCVSEIMGYNVFDENDNRNHMKSSLAKDSGVVCCQMYDNELYVWINNSNNTGKTNKAYTATDAGSLDGDSKVIFVK